MITVAKELLLHHMFQEDSNLCQGMKVEVKVEGHVDAAVHVWRLFREGPAEPICDDCD